MSNALYPKAREGFLAGDIDWDGNTIKAVLGRGYTYDSTDQFRADLTGHTAVATATIGATKSVTNGVAGTSASPTIDFGSPAAGAACTYIIIYQDTGSSATDRLICYIDTLATGAMSVTPTGAQITFTQDAVNGLFTL